MSVLLPTTRWTDACGELATQLRDSDELLICHDDEDDPVTEREEHPEGIRFIAAGEPEGCSGKANAIAAGMEAARHDRLVWTDDDFHHPSDWLATFSADYETHGPVSEVPYFVGRDPLSMLLEPLYASACSLPLTLGNQIWGGAVMFERADIDESAFLDELRRTVSDDGLLMEHLQVTNVGRTRIVPIGGTIHEAVERPVRWTQILRWHFPGAIAGTFLLSLLVLAGAVLAPIYAAAGLTVLHLAVNEVLGVRRWTAVLAFPAVFMFVPLVLYGLVRRTFVWSGRRYRWHGKFDVTVIE
ncbi:glycosyltransferase family 2 protein [Halocatena salina]|uniref:Glycosyltransferase family 2 protein n=2 Tax=Halocatena salina TaxID=2934340 RepID=A0A8T9ZZ34_9EURY|nr:glycosyltransferase [Halocatena salina]UPM41706.1 glycosyltransferase family 2 protein [Halocatena salina]